MPKPKFDENILIKGARVNNLQNISVEIPRNKLVVITGLSGSGKSSLAFDTLYAEGQRRYVESLSAYARQFLGRINKPEVDFIHGIPPAIAIEQKVNTSNPRSTVGTSTEIYEYLKLLYARIGRTYSPVSGKEVKKHSVTDVVNKIMHYPEGEKILLIALVKPEVKNLSNYLTEYKKEGLTRIFKNNKVVKIEDLKNPEEILDENNLINLVIDRLQVSKKEDFLSQCGDSVQSAMLIGKGDCLLKALDSDELSEFSVRFEEDGIEFEEPSVHMFSFNSPLGACPRCEGYGKIIGIDPDLVFPDKSLSIYNDVVACWRGETFSTWKEKLIYNAAKFDFPVHRPFNELTKQQIQLIWTGNKYFEGLNIFFGQLEEKIYKIQNRVMLARYRGKTICNDCNGSRLKKQASYVKINDKAITELVLMQVKDLKQFFDQIKLDKSDNKISGRLLVEIKNRIDFLTNVGLGYLTLNRLSSTLSGGESQRINLATALGSSLVGSLYILDEPSIGLHSRDTELLIKVLLHLKNLGNTVVVVEHDEEIMRSADHIIDIGPFAGRLGGNVIFEGDHKKLQKEKNSLTALFLNGTEKISIPKPRRKWSNYLKLEGVRENNLKGFNVKIPLQIMTVITGVSGSGKSSLVKTILYPSLNRIISGSGDKPGNFDKISGDIQLITGLEYVDQNPIGKSSRSNPVTYMKAYDEIRKLYASQAESMHLGYTPTHFSFNVDGGRCEECQGEGMIKVEMQFMADVKLVCESCHGMRFKEDILEVKYLGKNIYDVLEMTVEEAIEFFNKKPGTIQKRIVEKMQPLADVGLGYIKLGQSSSTLSGGESQRVKLASFISKDSSNMGPTMFIFDEPTTGLHFHDIRKLLDAFNALIKKGHTLVIIEHNLEIIKCADWIIDLGPEGGDQGGYLLFEGTPENLVNCEKSYTGQYLNEKLMVKS
jgi:excinuclease ABC subunit A